MINSKFQVSNYKKNGFTFLEIIIVFFVIIVGLLGVFSFVQYPISASRVSTQQFIATYLSQEGIEIVRNIRDANWLEKPPPPSWIDGLVGGTWQIGYDDTSLNGLVDDGRLYFDSNGWYNHNDSSGGETKFKRKITIDDSDSNYLKVSVEVSWTEKGKNYNVTAQENLYEWWPN